MNGSMTSWLRTLPVFTLAFVARGSDCGSSLDCVKGTLAAVMQAAEAKAKAEGELEDRYNCLQGLQDFVSWQQDRKDYCCTKHGLGCPGEAPDTKTIYVSSGETVDEDVSDEFAVKFAEHAANSAGWSYSASTKSGGPLPPWLSFDPNTLKLSGTAPDEMETDVAVKAVSMSAPPVTSNYNIRSKAMPPTELEVLAIAGRPMNYPLPSSSLDSTTPKQYEMKIAPGSSVPEWLLFDQTSGTLSGVPPQKDEYTLHISEGSGSEEKTQIVKLRVEESGNTGNTDVHGVTATDVELPPAVGEVAAPLQYALPAGAADPSSTASTADGEVLPAWLHFDAASGKLSGTPTQPAEIPVQIKSATEVDHIKVKVHPSPSAEKDNNPVHEVVAITGHAMNHQLPPSSVDSTTPKMYHMKAAPGSSVPDWLLFDQTSATLSGVPSEKGEYTLHISEGSGSEEKTQVVKLRVEESGKTDVHGVAATDVELPPAVGEVAAPLQYALPAGVADPSSTASTADGEPLPSWLSFDAASGKLSGTPAQAEEIPVQVKSGTEVDHFKVKIHSKSQQSVPPLDPKESTRTCPLSDMMCSPLDMNMTPSKAIQEFGDAHACQLACREEPSCGCFSYFPSLKLCHFASTMATLGPGGGGWQGNYAFCDKAMTGALGDTAFEKVMTDSCLAQNVSLAPKTTRPDVWPTTYVDTLNDCRKRCAHAGKDCKSFVFNTMSKSCDLQDITAAVEPAPPFEMAGPRVCNMKVHFTVTISDPPPFAQKHPELLQTVMDKVLREFAGDYPTFDGLNQVSSEPALLTREIETNVTTNSAEAIVLDVELHAPEQRLQFIYRKVIHQPDLKERFHSIVQQYLPADVAQYLGGNVEISRGEAKFRGQNYQQSLYKRLEDKLQGKAAIEGRVGYRTLGTNMAGVLCLGAWVFLGLGFLTYRRRSVEAQRILCRADCQDQQKGRQLASADRALLLETFDERHVSGLEGLGTYDDAVEDAVPV